MTVQRATMTSKGQITIPVDIRNAMHLTAGNVVQFSIANDTVVLVPINRSVTSLRGILPKPSKSLTLEEMNEVINGMYDRR